MHKKLGCPQTKVHCTPGSVHCTGIGIGRSVQAKKLGCPHLRLRTGVTENPPITFTRWSFISFFTIAEWHFTRPGSVSYGTLWTTSGQIGFKEYSLSNVQIGDAQLCILQGYCVM